MFLPLRVLIIEDSDDDVLIVLRELRRGGFEPEHIQVQTPEELQSALDNESWDLILSDYSLPRFSAPAALKILKRSKRLIPFFVISGAVGEEVAVQLMQAGAVDYVNKDNLTRLCPAVTRVLEEYKSRKQIKRSKALSDQLWEMVNQSQNEFFIFDAKTLLFKFVNQGALKNLGYSFSEMEKLHAYDIKPEYSQMQFEQLLKPLREGNQTLLQFQTVHMRKNKTTYPVEVRLQLTRSQEGSFFFAVILDITERLQANATIESLAKFPEENPAPVFRLSSKGEVAYSNPASQYIISHWSVLYNNHTPEHWITIIKECLQEKKVIEFEEQVNNRIYTWLFSPSSDTSYVNCYAYDVTQQRIAENDQRQAALVFDNSIEGIIITDSENKIIRVNPAFTEITGYHENEVLGKNPKFLKSNKHSEHFYEAMWYKLDKYGSWQGEVWNRRKNGDIYPEYMTISVLKDSEGNVNNYIGVFADISERVEAEKHIHRLAYYDPLTQLPNRFHIRDILTRQIGQAKARKEFVALVYLNLNRFKTINESLGHDIADEALRVLSQRIQNCVSNTAEVGRMGGDEFLISLKTPEPLHENSELLQRIISAIEEPIHINAQDIYIASSIGIAHYPTDGDDVDTLIKNAESAVNNAKTNDTVVTIFNKDLIVRGIEHFSFESNLRKALERNEFVLHYQPQIDLRTGNVIGAEALLRWNHPKKGLVPPGEFIPLLEETGLILPVGNWIIKSACEQIRAWKKLGIEIRVAINLSAKQFNQKDLSVTIENIVRETEINPHLLEIEVTESTIMNRYNHVISVLNDLNDCNIKLSIDDFGTGYSSLAYLKHFPIDVLKIDRSFVMELEKDKDDVAIVNTIISMGHNLNLMVIAEGVETSEQARILTDLGCEFAQGFYFSRPIPPEQCADFILKTNN